MNHEWVKKLLNIWMVLGIIAYIISGVLINRGWDRLSNYYQSETTSSMNNYVYVGGDAYNYIINSNVLTGYFTLSGALMIVGTLFILISRMEKNRRLTNEKIIND